MTWFNVDREGLRRQLRKRGIAWAVFELVQNAWDTDAECVDVRLEAISGAPFATLTVGDDSSHGFLDIEHAYTMFAPSNSAAHPTRRGRWNTGEKLVLAICRSAEICTTSGTVRFNEDGTRTRGRSCRERGTVFAGEIRMTRDEMREAAEQMLRLIPPIPTSFNGRRIERPEPIHTFEATLPTVTVDADGYLKPSRRKCVIELYAGDGEILELGIPVVECDLGYRVNVLQKVPLNSDRDNVPPSFVKALRVEILNEMHDRIEDVGEPWVSEAISDARCKGEAVRSVVRGRFGERAVVAVPGDPVANATAESRGYTVVHGGALPAGAWANVRKHEIVPASSKLFPSPTAEQTEKAAEMMEGKCPLCGK